MTAGRGINFTHAVWIRKLFFKWLERKKTVWKKTGLKKTRFISSFQTSEHTRAGGVSQETPGNAQEWKKQKEEGGEERSEDEVKKLRSDEGERGQVADNYRGRYTVLGYSINTY